MDGNSTLPVGHLCDELDRLLYALITNLRSCFRCSGVRVAVEAKNEVRIVGGDGNEVSRA